MIWHAAHRNGAVHYTQNAGLKKCPMGSWWLRRSAPETHESCVMSAIDLRKIQLRTDPAQPRSTPLKHSHALHMGGVREHVDHTRRRAPVAGTVHQQSGVSGQG